jgi:hypothetical protein
MFLYTNGDSFTAGSELADDILPGWPGYMRDCDPGSDAYRKNLQWKRNVWQNEQNIDLINKSENLGRTMAWPAALAKLFRCQHLNSGEGGSSFDRIARTTISDLINLKRQHTDIVAVLSTTDIFRCELPSTTSSYFWEPFDCKVMPESRGPEYREYLMMVKFKIKNETVFHRLWNFYYHALQIKNFCLQNNIRLYWVETFTNGLYPEADENNHPYIKPLKEEVNIIPIVSMSDVAHQDYYGDNKYCPTGHFRKEIHDLFARKIYKQII